MSAKQTLLDRELFTQALRHMGEEDLRYLNRMVVERLNVARLTPVVSPPKLSSHDFGKIKPVFPH